MRTWLAGAVAAALTGACATPAPTEGSGLAADWSVRPCPQPLAQSATCFGHRDANGAWIVAALPRNSNGSLVVFAHGGPRLGTPEADDPDEDLERFAHVVQGGYAWVGTTYRQGGFAVRRAAADVDAARAAFWARFGKPRRTLLHGQSWGAQVAAKASELHAFPPEGGGTAFDGVLLTNGVVAGGTRSYRFRADLRAVYQFYCANHPSKDEVSYPLWSGLPDGSQLTSDELEERVNACTGVNLAPSDRTIEQQQRLENITRVTGIRETQLLRHLEWATFTFQSLIKGLDGLNPFDNTDRAYAGSNDDEALNAGVVRFAADPRAVARLAFDSDPTGQIAVPTVTLHAVGDPVAFFALETEYARLVERSGRSDLLVQVATDTSDHSRPPPAMVMAALGALEAWVASGARPDAATIKARCLERASMADCPIATTAPSTIEPAR